jgi:predicted amidohydrolase
MRVGACQTPEILGDVDEAVRVVLGFARDAEAAGVDLLLFPECFLQGYLVTGEHVSRHAVGLGSAEFGEVLARLAPITPTVVLGLIEVDGGHYYNTAAVVTGGRVVGRYRKSRLTAGESVFTAGGAYPVFECGGVRFGVNICYDMQFAEPAAAVASNGARLVLVPAQNMMGREKAFHWEHRHNEIRGRRARETGLWVASADVTGARENRIGLGPTGFLDPSGQVTAQVPTGRAGMVTADIPGRGGREEPGARPV